MQWVGQLFFYFVLLRSAGLQTNLGFARFITGSTNIQPGMKSCTCVASCATFCAKVSKLCSHILLTYFSTYEQDNFVRFFGLYLTGISEDRYNK